MKQNDKVKFLQEIVVFVWKRLRYSFGTLESRRKILNYFWG